MPNDLDMSADCSGRRFVYDKDENTWINFGVVPIYNLVNRSTSGLVYPELYDKLKELENIQATGTLANLRLTAQKPYFYLFYSSDKLIRFKIEGEYLKVEVDKNAIFRKLTSSPCTGAKGPPGPDGLQGRTGLRAPLEKMRITNNEGRFNIDVPTPLDDQPISLRGYDQYGEEQLWEILINLDGSYNDPDHHTVSLELAGNTINGQLSDPTNKFKIRQRGPKGLNGSSGKDYVEVVLNEAISAGDFINAVGSLWFNSITNSFVFNRTDLSAVLHNVLSVVARTDLPTGNYWAGLQISSNSLKPVEFHRPALEFEYQDLSLPSWTPLSGCYDQKRYTLGYLNYNTEPFDIIKDPFPEYSGCKEPFWFCGNSGNQPCDGEINVNPAENTILFIESTSSFSSGSSLSSVSSSSSSISESTISSTSTPSSKSSSSSRSSTSSESTPSTSTSESSASSKSSASSESTPSTSTSESSASSKSSTSTPGEDFSSSSSGECCCDEWLTQAAAAGVGVGFVYSVQLTETPTNDIGLIVDQDFISSYDFCDFIDAFNAEGICQIEDGGEIVILDGYCGSIVTFTPTLNAGNCTGTVSPLAAGAILEANLVASGDCGVEIEYNAYPSDLKSYIAISEDLCEGDPIPCEGILGSSTEDTITRDYYFIVNITGSATISLDTGYCPGYPYYDIYEADMSGVTIEIECYRDAGVSLGSFFITGGFGNIQYGFPCAYCCYDGCIDTYNYSGAYCYLDSLVDNYGSYYYPDTGCNGFTVPCGSGPLTWDYILAHIVFAVYVEPADPCGGYNSPDCFEVECNNIQIPATGSISCCTGYCCWRYDIGPAYDCSQCYPVFPYGPPYVAYGSNDCCCYTPPACIGYCCYRFGYGLQYDCSGCYPFYACGYGFNQVPPGSMDCYCGGPCPYP